MNNLLRNIVTAVLLAFGWVAPLCAAPLTQAEVDALYERIDALYAEGMNAYKAGDYAKTTTLLTEAVALQKQIAEDEDLLAMSTTLAAAQSQAGEYQAALTTTENSIALAKRLKGDSAPELTQLENNRAYLQSKISMPVEERVEIVRHTIVREADTTAAQRLFAQATAAYRQGDCQRALQLTRQAVAMDTLKLIYDSDIRTAYHNIAACRMEGARGQKNRGEYKQALKSLQAILDEFGQSAPKKEIESEMASCYSLNGDYEKAISIYNRLLQQDPTNAAIQNNLALCYARIGDYSRSLSMQEKALRLTPDNAELLTNIATTYFRQGDYSKALQTTDRAAEIIRRKDGEQSAAYATALVNRGACLAMLERTDEALAANEQALAIQNSVLGANHINVATTLNNIADCHYRRLDYQQAMDNLQLAAQIRKNVLGVRHPDYIFTVNNIAACCLALGDKAGYAARKQECLNWMLSDVRQNFTWLTEQQRQLFVQQRTPLLEGIVASYCPDGMQYDKQLLTKGLLLSSAVELERIMHEAKDAEITRLFGELRTIRLALDGLYAQPADAQDRPQIEQLSRQAEAAEQQLLARSQAYGNLTRSLTYHWQDVQKALKDNEIAVEFAKAGQGDESQYVALVLRKGWSAPKSVRVGKQADFAEYIQKRYRAYEYEELGNAIWHDVLAAAGAKDGEVIYFSPDGFMYQMGIEYLTADGKLMNDAYQMCRLSSTRMLCQKPKHATGKDMTLFGGLLYGPNNTKGEKFQYLPATLKEVQNISAMYPGSKTITGGEGTEEAFYALSGQSPAQLHIATHGFYIKGERAQEMAAGTRGAGFIRIGANSEVADNSMSRTGLLLSVDVYGEFLDELIAGNTFLKGVMAQNTFAMTRKAVDAVVARATSGEMVPTFYITSANLGDPNVQPFLEFYGRTNSSTGEVRLTQQYMVAVRTTGDTVTTVTQDFVWENGLLRRSNIHNFVAYTGSTINDETIYDYDNDGNCIAEHYTATNLNYDRYYTYEGGRMTSAVEVRGSDTIGRATITGYTADGHIQSLTVESLASGRVTDYQLTWQNGDMTGYTKHPVTPAGEDDSYTIEYDNYPNIRTGMPLAGSVFDPEMIASKASVHNWYVNNQEYTYGNGRLIRATSSTSALSTVTYYTYSDGTTGRE